ncbi:pyrroline-5-carboxylate reductase dimerization domain-containing protein [Pseudomonas sp. D2002]|uniref:pyrroline-5-carboxylate reductase dimerization domain-containing protein n=1 Tax=Pseudomonas sp. D2002 TaxID=2726980 RepID=UPI0015A0C3D8|nr:pyrroline-5-carboxylate reductase dimerization domain-containing protein [Pseudomonas sp. D2002]NWA83274.1 hypothetical protein [Pseudomonas sp. D2002]
MQQWFTEKGLSHEQAAELVMGNMQDCLASARHQSHVSMEALGRSIATPGTFTSVGLEKLQKNGGMLGWREAFDEVLKRMKKSA